MILGLILGYEGKWNESIPIWKFVIRLFYYRKNQIGIYYGLLGLCSCFGQSNQKENFSQTLTYIKKYYQIENKIPQLVIL